VLDRVAIKRDGSVSLACQALSRAINALNEHHAEERDGFASSLAVARRKLDDRPENAVAGATQAIQVIEQSASRLRDEREAALARLLAMREQLVDVILEGNALFPDDAPLSADVEAERLPTAPKPLLGAEPRPDEAIRVLADTYIWTRDTTHGCAMLALGPLYRLGLVIEHPTPEASKLRADARMVCDEVRRLLYRASRSLGER
jgi:hypothetical protein